SFPDEVIYPAFELLTEVDLDGIKEKAKQNPMGEKKNLAFEIVKLLWGEESAKNSQNVFEQNFQEKKPEFNIRVASNESLIKTIMPYSPRGSVSSVKELLKQNAVDVNGVTVTDGNVTVQPGDEIKVGSHTFLKAK